MRFRLVVDGESHDIEVEETAKGFLVRVDGALYRGRSIRGDSRIEVRLGGHRHRIEFRGTTVVLDGQSHEVLTEAVEAAAAGPLSGPQTQRKGILEIRPPMPGRVVRVVVSPGASVKRGQTLVVLEAMKMQNEIPAPADVIVREVRVREGESIPADRVIAVLETT